MEQKYLNSLKELKFADMPEKQKERLRELEKQFNNEFNQDLYFMAMKRGDEKDNINDMWP